MMRPGRGVVLTACLALLVGCSADVPRPTSPSSAPTGPASSAAPTSSPSGTAQAPPTGTCLDAAAALSLDARIGQVIMVGVGGDLDAAEKRAITASKLGSVVLLGDQSGGVAATAELVAELDALNPKAGMLVAVDQEGGLVQRLTGDGFDTIPSAASQAKLSTKKLRASAEAWGAELAKAGVLLNLAPVADVVPASKRTTNAPIGRLGRGYGSDPAVVTAKTGAVIAGMGDAGVAAAVKHFPGLGEVVGNTDHTGGVVDRVTGADSASLRPFRAAAGAGVGAVMVSSATYSRIDAKRQAVFSPKVIGLLRGWGYDGVVISDDLGAAASLASVPAAQRAVKFLAAGGDLVINADPGLTAQMVSGVRQRAQGDSAFEQQVTESVARVLTLKQKLGRYTCG